MNAPLFRYEWEFNAAWASSRGPKGQMRHQIFPHESKKLEIWKFAFSNNPVNKKML